MTIGPKHWIDGVRKDSIPGGREMPIRRLLVIHFTSGMSAQSSIDYWRKLGTGILAHIIIDRDGTIIQCRAFNRTAGHAGRSRWRDTQTNAIRQNCNEFSIGIELANAGDSVQVINGRPLAFGKYEVPAGAIRAKHKNGGPARWWERYPEPQIKAVTELSRALVAYYNLDDVIGHDDCAPERKNDPGPCFDISALREACGFCGEPVVNWP